MPLSENKKTQITQVIQDCLRKKFLRYKPETNSMPFHYRLIGKDRMALFSFIQSLNTTFGASIFEPVAVALSQDRFQAAKHQYLIGDTITTVCQQAIQEIMNTLSTGGIPNKEEELDKIRLSARKGLPVKIKTVKVDLFLQDFSGEVFLFDLKTAKPNISNFKDFKRTLLEWAGIALHNNSALKVNSLIAIPYNPYEPEKYERWTLKGMFDFDKELKVAEEFWDFLGGENTYNDLLECFAVAGDGMRPEVDKYFSQFKASK
jgi:type II restriction enzyme